MSTRSAPDDHSGSVARYGVLFVAGLTALLILAAVWRIARRPQPPSMTLLAGASRSEPSLTRSDRLPDDLVLPSGVRSISVVRNSSSGVGDSGRWLDSDRLDDFRSADTAVAEIGGTIPPHERWRIYFESGLSEGAYARQLDALGIELAVLVGDGTIQYASKLAEARPETRTGKAGDEHRMYLTWDRGDLVEADRVLLANAGVASAGKIILHFCLPDSATALEALELAFQNRSVDQIRQTRFGVKRTFRGYEVVVIDQVTP